MTGGVVEALEKLRCPRKPISISPRIDQFARRVVGRRVVAVERVGKRVVLRFDSDDRLIFEPRMTGLLLVGDPPDPLYLRLRIEFAGAKNHELWFWDRRGLGHIRLLSPGQFESQLGPDKLGPDALAITACELREKLRLSRRAIKVALLDQRVVAGIGNLYAAEILHVAGVHPAKSCRRLRKIDWEAIVDATRLVLNDAIRYEGSTLGDGTYRNALNKDGSYQNQHRVYAKAGTTCRRCKEGVIERIVQAQRSTFFCRICQPRR